MASIESFSLTCMVKYFLKGCPSNLRAQRAECHFQAAVEPQHSRDEVPGLAVVHQLTAFSLKGGRSCAATLCLVSLVSRESGCGASTGSGPKVAPRQQVLCVQPASFW